MKSSGTHPHNSRLGMSAVTSVGFLASAAITDHIHNPRIRMASRAAVAVLISLAHEWSWQHRVTDSGHTVARRM